MTKKIDHNNIILAIAPSSKGFGYAVLEGKRKLVDWGVRTVVGDKNTGTLKATRKMVELYKPCALVLHDTSAQSSRRGPRIRTLTKNIIAMARRRKIKVALLSRDQMMDTFFIDAKGTKYGLAKVLAAQFPEELGPRLPRKRKDWESEDFRMSIFEAVALAMTHRLWKKSNFGPSARLSDPVKVHTDSTKMGDHRLLGRHNRKRTVVAGEDCGGSITSNAH